MDDMNGFEQRLSAELEHIAGPPRHVDARAIRQQATAATPVKPWSALTRRLGAGSMTSSSGRSLTMFSAIKFIAAAAVVALFGGFLLSGVLTQQPDTELTPAGTSGSPSPEPSRIEVPEAGFAVTFPEGWTSRVEPVTPSALAEDRFDLMAIVYADDADGSETCELSAYLGHIDTTDPDVEQVSLQAETQDRRLCEEGEFVPALCDWELATIPAGEAALEVFTERWDFGAVPHPGAQWLTTDGSDLYQLVCSSDDPPDDHWRPIMETFEFLPVESQPASAFVATGMTTDRSLTGLVTEQVEPGVLRVLHDGVRPLAEPEQIPDGWHHLSVDREGGVWLFGWNAFVRLGAPGTYLLPGNVGGVPGSLDDVEIAPDGTVWMAGSWSHWPSAADPDSDDPMTRTESGAIYAFDGVTWTERALPVGQYANLDTEILADGTVWVASWPDTIMRLDGEQWEAIELPGCSLFEMRASDTEIWTDSGPGGTTDCDGTLYRFDGTDWQAFETPEGYLGRGGIWGSAPVGADGTLWVAFRRESPGVAGEPSGAPTGIARFDGTGWQEWEATDFPDEGVRNPVNGGWNFEAIGPDGSLWALPHECAGVGRFDGTTVTHYLAGRCIESMDVTPDGTAWLAATTWDGEPDGIYVIRPEDAATHE